MGNRIYKAYPCEDGVTRSVAINPITLRGIVKVGKLKYSGEVKDGLFVINPNGKNGNPFKSAASNANIVKKSIRRGHNTYVKARCEDGVIRTIRLYPTTNVAGLSIDNKWYSGKYDPVNGTFTVNPNCKNGNPFKKEEATANTKPKTKTAKSSDEVTEVKIDAESTDEDAEEKQLEFPFEEPSEESNLSNRGGIFRDIAKSIGKSLFRSAVIACLWATSIATAFLVIAQQEIGYWNLFVSLWFSAIALSYTTKFLRDEYREEP